MTIEELGKHCVIIDFNDLFTKSVTNINYKQGEIGTASIKAKLVKKRTPIDLTGCRIILNIMTEKGEPIVDTATILDEKEGIVEIKFEQVSLNTGISFFELTVMDASYNTKKSPKIAYRVLDSLSEDAVIESERFPILVNMIKDVDELHTTTTTLINETTQLKQQVIELNDTMTQAELVRETQEGTRQENEIVRQQNETVRIENMERINQEMVDFKEEVNTTVDTFKGEVNTTVDGFKISVNETVSTFKQEVNNTVSALPRIDNVELSDVNTYSSRKIQEELNKKSEFDGSYLSLTDLPEEYVHPETHPASMILHSDGTSTEDKLVAILETIGSIMTRLEALEAHHTPTEPEAPVE